jgi:hypothetical protein
LFYVLSLAQQYCGFVCRDLEGLMVCRAKTEEVFFMRRLVREAAFRMARSDLLRFIEDHEDDLLRIFREEMEGLDDRLPEEQVFIDIHMVALGEELLAAVLTTLKRFLEEY